ncbi:MAG: hypothetical protein ACI4XB_09725, partial [Ruminococcus sp.]
MLYWKLLPKTIAKMIGNTMQSRQALYAECCLHLTDGKNCDIILKISVLRKIIYRRDGAMLKNKTALHDTAHKQLNAVPHKAVYRSAIKIPGIFILLIAGILLIGCSKNDTPADDRVSVTENVVDEETMTYETWQTAYKEFLRKQMDFEENPHATHFSLMYFDADEIPELCIGIHSDDDSGMRFYQIYKAEADSE